MRKRNLVVAAAAILALMATTASAEFYYSGGRQIPLKVDSIKVTIKFDDVF